MGRSVCWCLVVLATVACSSKKTGQPDGGGGGGGGDPGGVSDMSSFDLAQGPPQPTPSTRRGLVNVIDNGTTTTTVNAHFWDFPPGACTITYFGSCQVNVCASGTVAGAELDAGTIALGGGAQPESLTFNGGAYTITPALPSGTQIWPVGTAVSVDAAGKTVAPFNTSVTIPPGITALTAGGSSTIARNQDLPVAWSGGGALFLWELVSSSTAAGPSMQCTFPATAQAGTVPKEALTALPAGNYSLEVFTADQQSLPSGNGFVRVSGASFYRTFPAVLQ